MQIGLFGRTNVGKSSFLNLVAGQDVAITSPLPGTSTDVVEKSMELLPLGPVLFLDTAGLDDTSVIAKFRLKKTVKIFDRSDVVILVLEPNVWTAYEDHILDDARKHEVPFLLVVNKVDQQSPTQEYIEKIKEKSQRILFCSSIDFENRDRYVDEI